MVAWTEGGAGLVWELSAFSRFRAGPTKSPSGGSAAVGWQVASPSGGRWPGAGRFGFRAAPCLGSDPRLWALAFSIRTAIPFVQELSPELGRFGWGATKQVFLPFSFMKLDPRSLETWIAGLGLTFFFFLIWGEGAGKEGVGRRKITFVKIPLGH